MRGSNNPCNRLNLACNLRGHIKYPTCTETSILAVFMATYRAIVINTAAPVTIDISGGTVNAYSANININANAVVSSATSITGGTITATAADNISINTSTINATSAVSNLNAHNGRNIFVILLKF